MKLPTIEAIASALNAADVQYIVVGGLAVVVHGYGRYTSDLDLVIRLEPTSVRHAFEALASLGYRPRVPVTAEQFGDSAHRARLIAEKGMQVLNFHSDAHRETPVDVFITEPFDFAPEYANALVQEIAHGVPMRIVALRTLIRLKQSAARPQDLADVSELRLLHGDAIDG